MGTGAGERKWGHHNPITAIYSLFPSLLLLSVFFTPFGNAEPIEDKNALLDFINKLPHYHHINWDSNTPVCSNWTGVTCTPDKSRVIAVRLPGVGFNGHIPSNTLGRLTSLKLLSLRSNRIKGLFPSDFFNLRNLSMLYLQSNEFSGPLPLDFSIWKNLSVVDLSNNRFNGSLPKTMSELSHLSYLNLANNSLSGDIPDLGLSSLVALDLSHNNLSGVVPKSLQRFPSSAFVGNHVLLLNSSLVSPATSPPDDGEKSSSGGDIKHRGVLKSKWLLIVIIISSVIGVVAFVILLLGCCFRRRKAREEDGFTGKFPKGNMSPEKVISGGGKDAKNGLVFFEGCNYAFDLEDLLRASAEVLGKGTFGMSYKAILEDANVVVVKRLKDVSAGKKEFEGQMDIIGKIRHDNVVALRAYYYSKDEKLMVNDFCFQGSVSALLHENRAQDRIPLDWETRMRIAVGAARGIAHIHTENNGKLVHGNLRSSNIFLNSQQYGCVSDFGLAPVMSPLGPPISRVTGYRAPEVTDTRKASQASDVYSFGVFILELLTGKSPIHTMVGEEHVHLVRWVHSVVREEWTAEVFDIELMRYPNIEEEMVEMLQIAMSCVVRFADQRPKMAEVVKMIENVRHTDADAEKSCETGSSLTRAESQ